MEKHIIYQIGGVYFATKGAKRTTTKAVTLLDKAIEIIKPNTDMPNYEELYLKTLESVKKWSFTGTIEEYEYKGEKFYNIKYKQGSRQAIRKENIHII